MANYRLFCIIGFVPPERRDETFTAWMKAVGSTRIIYQTTHRVDSDPPPLGPLEWRVLDAMLDGPRATLSALAKQAGLSSRTVERRRRALVEKGVVEVAPILGPSRSNRLFFHLALLGFSGSPQEALKHLPGTVLVERYGGFSPQSALFLFCETESLPAQAELIAHAARIPGVKEAFPYLLTEYRVNTERLRGWIEAELTPWNKAKRG